MQKLVIRDLFDKITTNSGNIKINLVVLKKTMQKLVVRVQKTMQKLVVDYAKTRSSRF